MYTRLESSIEHSLRKWVLEQGLRFVKIQGQGNRGNPDRAVCFPRSQRILFMELKKDTGKLSKLQEYVIGRMREEGYAVAVCYTVEEGKDAVQQRLDEGW
jgi:G:T-mismatch repair DNA endonuclease (very short patch repair protein)